MLKRDDSQDALDLFAQGMLNLQPNQVIGVDLAADGRLAVAVGSRDPVSGKFIVEQVSTGPQPDWLAEFNGPVSVGCRLDEQGRVVAGSGEITGFDEAGKLTDEQWRQLAKLSGPRETFQPVDPLVLAGIKPDPQSGSVAPRTPWSDMVRKRLQAAGLATRLDEARATVAETLDTHFAADRICDCGQCVGTQMSYMFCSRCAYHGLAAPLACACSRTGGHDAECRHGEPVCPVCGGPGCDDVDPWAIIRKLRAANERQQRLQQQNGQ